MENTIEIKSIDYRYALGKKSDKEIMYFLGINPSNATLRGGEVEKISLDDNVKVINNGKLADDPTIKLVQMIAENNNKSWVMLNIYPERAYNIKYLPVNFDKSAHNKNLEYIKNIVVEKSEMVAIWGDNITERNYFLYCLKDIINILEGKQIIWKCIAETKINHNPVHPISFHYKRQLDELKKLSCPLKDFDINEYINKKFPQNG